MQYVSANSARASTTSASAAPQASARLRIVSRSSPPWPTSTATAITSAPARSAIQPIATEVSSPPEEASTTFSVCVATSSPLFYVFGGWGGFDSSSLWVVIAAKTDERSSSALRQPEQLG